MTTHTKQDESGTPEFSTSRRTVLKASAIAVAAPMVLTTRKTDAQVLTFPPSPATTPWVEELPVQDTPLQPVVLNPHTSIDANTAAGECGRGPHQRYAEVEALAAPTEYELKASVNSQWVFNPAYPAQVIWGYEGNTPNLAVSPGPTIHARYGKPIILRMRNNLVDTGGFGSPEISTHLHNLHTPSESDGFAGDYYSATVRGPTLTAAGSFNDHCYPNVYAGFDEFKATNPFGDPREALGSLFYHDHTENFTAPNILRGLVGRYNLYDELDSGNETDPNPVALRLPSGPCDYPLTFKDARFGADKQLFFDDLNPEGVLGDKTIVNGKIEPVLRVARRKYRFRLLNAGPSRFYAFVLQNAARNTIYTYQHIANDGNLLPSPLTTQRVQIAPAERADIVINFANFPVGTRLYLVNQLNQLFTRLPDRLITPGTQVIQFHVDRNASDPSRVPTTLRALRDSDAQLAAFRAMPTTPGRRFVFARSSGNWTVNNQLFNVNVPRAVIQQHTSPDQFEIWEFVNPDNGWQHPIHVHFEEGRLLSKVVNGVNQAIPLHERGRKDVFVLGELMTMRVLFRFRDFKGKYLMHCHNLTHEDHSMMVRYDIV